MSCEAKSCVFVRKLIFFQEKAFLTSYCCFWLELWILMWEDNRARTFSLEEVLLGIMDSYFVQKKQFKIQMY